MLFDPFLFNSSFYFYEKMRWVKYFVKILEKIKVIVYNVINKNSAARLLCYER